ncbi:MAG TPA: sugar transferase [Solirubrobacteraceae bacterium]|nr:sugar transferase [Solirubrobacteraceae bacterium]
MSSDPTPLAPVPAPADAEHGAVDEHAYRSRSSWPATRLPAAGMTLILGLAVAAPAVTHDVGSKLWPALLLPALLATLAARLVFESVDGSLAGRRVHLHLPAAAAGAAVGTVVMAAATLILGLKAGTPVELLPFGLGAVTLVCTGFVRDLEIRMRLALRRVYFAGSADSLRELQHELIRSPEASLVGSAGARSPFTTEALTGAIQRARPTVLVLDRDAAHAPAIVAAAEAVGGSDVRVRDLLTYYESEFKKVPLTELTPAWFLFEREEQQRRALSSAARRGIVMLTAAVLLLVALPLIAVLSLAIRLTSTGPAIFRQARVGKDGSLFTLVKLRTMAVADPEAADRSASWATDEDHRITPLGRLLRRYRLDELPQLWNVLRGELALVGPRPEQVPIVERLEREIPFYAARHTVRPGLTGWAQVNLGYSGSLEGARAKLQRDLYYVKHRGLRLDLLILWLTLKAVFTDPR